MAARLVAARRRPLETRSRQPCPRPARIMCVSFRRRRLFLPQPAVVDGQRRCSVVGRSQRSDRPPPGCTTRQQAERSCQVGSAPLVRRWVWAARSTFETTRLAHRGPTRSTSLFVTSVDRADKWRGRVSATERFSPIRTVVDRTARFLDSPQLHSGHQTTAHSATPLRRCSCDVLRRQLRRSAAFCSRASISSSNALMKLDTPSRSS